MKVKELITLLENFQPEMEIFVGEEDSFFIDEPSISKIYYELDYYSRKKMSNKNSKNTVALLIE